MNISNIEKVVADCLMDGYYGMKASIEQRKGPRGYEVFHTDQAKDILTMVKYMEAFKLLSEYYGVKEFDEDV